jgi:hypothetical protein
MYKDINILHVKQVKNVYTIYIVPLSVQAQYSKFCHISSSFRYNGSIKYKKFVHNITMFKYIKILVEN